MPATMTTAFISDLHLDAADELRSRILLAWLQRSAGQLERLYILGDLFEAWIGDDDPGELATEIAAALNLLAAQGTWIGFVHGNRDFLLGQHYAARCRMHLLPDPCVIELAGMPTLIAHGDLLCSADLPYQAFRRQVRDPAWQRSFLSQPLAQRQAFARAAREQSMRHQQGVEATITDVSPADVEAWFKCYGVNRLIHGHTHRPATHTHAVEQRNCERIVLADWRDAGEVLLTLSDGTLHRQRLTV